MFLNKQDVLQNGYRMVSLSSKIARYKIFVNVGESDMAFNGGDERIAFGPMAKGQKMYGSTSTRLKRNEQIVVYNVQKDDTLQGIAIKFGVHTEHIRRVNQMWTNDSLFLRDKLLIPVPKEEINQNDSDCHSSLRTLDSPITEQEFKMKPHWSHPLCDSFDEDCIVSPNSVKLGSTYSNLDLTSPVSNWCYDKDGFHQSTVTNGGDNGCSSTELRKNTYDNGTSYQNAVSDTYSDTTSAVPGTPTSSTSSSRRCTIVDHSEKSAEEFLSRIDSAIATSRNHSKLTTEDNKPPWVTFDSDSDPSDHKNSTGTSVTREGRHLRYSLKKLEKAQDELFEL